MSRLIKAVSALNAIVSSALESPRSTFDALRLLPAVAKGLEFSRSAGFPPPPEGPDVTSPGSNPLADYFKAHTEGPGLWKCLHYFDIYHRHFQKFVGREVHVLEVGIYSGGSLGMWREYFGKGCHIYGVDIAESCMAYKSEGVDVFIGDQSDRDFWKRFRQAVPKLDILIDDGGHAPEQQRITLEEMLPHLQPGGVYLCEDIGGSANPFAAFVGALATSLSTSNQVEDVFGSPIRPTPFQASVDSVTQYPFVTVIEKLARHPGLFVAEKHGTEWQPF